MYDSYSLYSICPPVYLRKSLALIMKNIENCAEISSLLSAEFKNIALFFDFEGD